VNLVQPIRDRAKIEQVKAVLLKQSPRDHLLFVLGINTGLRISDILKLRVGDVQNSHIVIKEQKTGKVNRFLVNQKLRKALDEHTRDLADEEYLFPSRKGGRPILRGQAYRILNTAAEAVGLTEIGTHTLRKTFGYHHYRRFKDVALLQEILNHSSPSVTLRYIGINQDLLDQSIKDFSVGL
jgi:integrase